MPDHITHIRLHKYWGTVLYPASAVTGFIIGEPAWLFSVFSVLGYALHPYFNQDLDQPGTSETETEWERTVVLSPLRGVSTLYARLNLLLPPFLGFPRGHRSFWSHFPPVSAFLRLSFFWLVGYFLLWLLYSLLDWPFDLAFFTPQFWGLYIGLQYGDWVHSIADWMEDLKKRKAPKKAARKQPAHRTSPAKKPVYSKKSTPRSQTKKSGRL